MHFKELSLYGLVILINSAVFIREIASITAEDPSAALHRLQETIYEQRWPEYPESGTYLGHHEYNDVLESYTLVAFKRRKDNCENILRQANDINAGKLSQVERRELKILKSYLSTFINGYRWRDYGSLNTVNFLEGIGKGAAWTFYSKFDTEEDFENYLKRLTAFPTQIDEQIALMRRSIRLKRTNHKASVDRVPDILKTWKVEDNFLVPIEESLKISDLPKDIKELILVKAQEKVDDVKRAFIRLQNFIEEDYMKATRPHEGIHTLPNGDQYYRACLKWYLGFDMSPDEIFNLGVKEVDRIEKQMKRVMESVDFHGDLKSFFHYLKYIPTFYNHTKEQLLFKYKDIITDKVFPRLQFMFNRINLPPISIVAVDNDGPWGLYGKSVFYVNLKDQHKRSTFMMMPLALHETNPGHHFQYWYSQQFNIPKYRTVNMNAKLYAVPFQFPVYSAYAEGWGLYAEYLGEEMGLYETPFEQFGRYCSEIFRACRLVVDTGIHAFGWDRDMAIKFLSNYSDFPLSQIEGEVDRYITWPGQACSYKIGEIKIKKLRHEAETRLGRLFNIKEFHHVVLNMGPVPLDILEEEIYLWIDDLLVRKSTREATTQRQTAISGGERKHVTSLITFIITSIVLFSMRR